MLATKRIKDMTADELRDMIRETVSEALDIEALKESIEIASDKRLVSRIKSSQRAYKGGKKDKFVTLKELKKHHGA